VTNHDDIASESPNVSIIREYFRRSDARQADVFELLDDDIEFYFPKHGVGRGKRAYAEFGAVLGQTLDVYHDQQTLRFIEAGNHVVVEGTTYGRDSSGHTWQGGETPGGRFCCVYEVHDGRITRSFIYADPDYSSRDNERFLWGMERSW
jgi:ketosteroid isomerase-like protein